jgi:TPR repeat protein
MRRRWKTAVWIGAAAIAVPAVLISPPFGELSLALTCRMEPPTSLCVARMRAMGHVWTEFGWLGRAITWYERAAAGSGDPIAYFHLGWLYEHRGQTSVVPRMLDYNKSLEAATARDQARLKALVDGRIKKAIDAGKSPADVKITDADLGELEAPKIPEPKLRDDFERAEAAYRKAAERGFAPAMNNLGQIYLNGVFGSARRGEGVPWLVRAAEAGNPVGSINLSLVYTDGMTVPRDLAQAERWSHWTDKVTDPRDLASPTLEHTNMVLAGTLDRPLVAAIRAKAKTKEELTVTFRSLPPDQHLPTFESVRKAVK